MSSVNRLTEEQFEWLPLLVRFCELSSLISPETYSRLYRFEKLSRIGSTYSIGTSRVLNVVREKLISAIEVGNDFDDIHDSTEYHEKWVILQRDINNLLKIKQL